MGQSNNGIAKKTTLSGMLPEEIGAVCNLPQRFQSLQVFQWIARGCTSFEEMTNLPLKERERLAGEYTPRNTVCETVLKDPDGTVKLGIGLHDGSSIETVLLFDKAARKTACVSCQVGCPMGCVFCQTGQLGCLRNLSPNEIVE